MIGNALQAFFCVLDEVAGGRGKVPLLFPDQDGTGFQRRRERAEAKTVKAVLQAVTEGCSHTMLHHGGGVANQVIGGGNLRLVTSIPEPGGQFLGDTSPRWHQKRDSAQLFGAEGGLRREGRILTEQHAPALFVGHTKDVILAALCRFQQQPQIQSALFQAVIQSVSLEGNYMILLAHDAYDVPYRGKDGEEQEDASSEVFSYLICAICPVKLTKPALSYQVQEGTFCTKTADWVVAPPALGFLFPAFDDRSANIYDALYYTKDIQDVQEALVASVFGTPAPMPAAAQQESFRAVLGEALEEDCCLQVVQAVHDQLCGLMEDHKESHETQPLVVGKREVRQALSANGVSQEHMDAFEGKYDEAFGADAQLSPRNLVDPKRVELKPADVTIKVNPARSDLVQPRVLNGVKYILVRVEEGVELNGVPVQIQE